jgi:hypothetical protein
LRTTFLVVFAALRPLARADFAAARPAARAGFAAARPVARAVLAARATVRVPTRTVFAPVLAALRFAGAVDRRRGRGAPAALNAALVPADAALTAVSVAPCAASTTTRVALPMVLPTVSAARVSASSDALP